jgi:hypothetical protein
MATFLLSHEKPLALLRNWLMPRVSLDYRSIRKSRLIKRVRNASGHLGASRKMPTRSSRILLRETG